MYENTMAKTKIGFDVKIARKTSIILKCLNVVVYDRNDPQGAFAIDSVELGKGKRIDQFSTVDDRHYAAIKTIV